jgi:A/G-specific adenine glycosylase
MLDRKRPGTFNQAMMELGATVCLPREPRCAKCPVAGFCVARREGKERELPVKLRKMRMKRLARIVLIVEQDKEILMWQRTDKKEKLAGFWELPEPDQLPKATIGAFLGAFRHAITDHNFLFHVYRAKAGKTPSGFMYIKKESLKAIPLSTSARKALRLLHSI